jgi:hypothetical protein
MSVDFREVASPDRLRCPSVYALEHHSDGEYAMWIQNDLLAPVRIEQIFATMSLVVVAATA